MDAFHALRLVHGLRGGVPFIEWWIDGVLRHQLTGAFGSFMDLGGAYSLHEQLAVFHAASSVDTITAWHPGPWRMGFTS